MRRFLILAALCAGCSGGQQASNAAMQHSSNAAVKTLKVALLTPGPVNDAGWSAMAYSGLMAIKDQTGAEVSQEEASGEARIKDSMRTYAQKGYNLIFGHGY